LQKVTTTIQLLCGDGKRVIESEYVELSMFAIPRSLPLTSLLISYLARLAQLEGRWELGLLARRMEVKDLRRSQTKDIPVSVNKRTLDLLDLLLYSTLFICPSYFLYPSNRFLLSAACISTRHHHHHTKKPQANPPRHSPRYPLHQAFVRYCMSGTRVWLVEVESKLETNLSVATVALSLSSTCGWKSSVHR